MGIIRTILVPLEDTHAPSALATAFRLAVDLKAHVVGLHVRDDPTAMMPLIGEGMSSGMIEEMMSAAEQQGELRLTEIHALFERMRQEQNITALDRPPPSEQATVASARWESVVGREDDLLARRSRLADLVVMSRPPESENVQDAAFQMLLNAILMESGKPVLLAPPQPTPTVAQRIAIAWNGSAEAARAVSSALPFLKTAGQATILIASESAKESNRQPAQDLMEYLAWHGVQTGCEPVQGSNAGSALLEACERIGADLLVMGAYTHSRLRQLIMGGVTRHVLAHAKIPCLLRH